MAHAAWAELQRTCEVLEADYEAAMARLLMRVAEPPEQWEVLAAMTAYRRWQDAMTVRRELAYRGAK